MPLTWRRVLLAVALPVAAVALGWVGAARFPFLEYLLIALAACAAAWICGPWLGLLATLGGAALNVYLLQEPRFSMAVPVAEVAPTIGLVIAGSSFAWFLALYRSGIRKAGRAESQRLQDARWALAVDAGGLGLWQWDCELKQVTQSPRYRQMLGYDDTEDFVAPDTEFFESVHPEDFPRLHAVVEPHLQGRTPGFACEFRVRHRDGRYIWVAANGLVARRGPRGEPLLMLGSHIDITARHAQMQAVSRAKDELQCALRSMTDAVVVFDAGGALLEYNEAFVRFSRDPHHAAPPGSLAEFAQVFECFKLDRTPVPPEEWSVAKALAGASSTDEPIVMRRLDTGDEWVASFNYAPLKSPDGLVWGAVVVARDITEKLRLEESVRAGNERLQRAYEMQSLALQAGEFGAFEFSLPDRVFACSDQCRRLCGLAVGSTEETVDLSATVHAEDRPRVEVAIARGIANGGIVDEEYRVIWPDGSLHWLQWTGRAIYENGQPVRFAGLLRASRNDEMRLLAEGIQQMVWISDGRKVVYCNQQWLDFCGATLESQLGYGWIGSLHPDDQERLRQAVESPWVPGVDRLEQHYRLRRHDGEYRWCISRGRRMQATPDSKPLWYGSTVDVHDLHVALEQARGAERAKAAFLASTSHELRTPLNSIIGFTTLLTTGELGPLRDEQKRPLEIVHRSSRQLLALVQDVLDFSAIEGGNLKLAIRSVPLAGLLDEVREQFMPRAAARKLDLPAVECDAHLQVRADPARLGQAVRNLVANGMNYTDHGYVQVRAAREREWVRIEVRDTGIGIPPAEAHKLFRPFDPIQRGEHVMREGTGLGLAITRRIVEMMGGEVGCESQPGVGSTFWIKVPLAD